jgi:AmiR/NasT family two-component response regulator
VILVTSDDQPETAKRALLGRAHATIIKPLKPKALEAELNKGNIR